MKHSAELLGIFREINGELALGNVVRATHKNGITYRLLTVCLREHDLVPCMIYENESNWGTVWARPLTEMLDENKWQWVDSWNLKGRIQRQLERFNALKAKEEGKHDN